VHNDIATPYGEPVLKINICNSQSHREYPGST